MGAELKIENYCLKCAIKKAEPNDSAFSFHGKNHGLLKPSNQDLFLKPSSDTHKSNQPQPKKQHSGGFRNGTYELSSK